MAWSQSAPERNQPASPRPTSQSHRKVGIVIIMLWKMCFSITKEKNIIYPFPLKKNSDHSCQNARFLHFSASSASFSKSNLVCRRCPCCHFRSFVEHWGSGCPALPSASTQVVQFSTPTPVVASQRPSYAVCQLKWSIAARRCST